MYWYEQRSQTRLILLADKVHKQETVLMVRHQSHNHHLCKKEVNQMLNKVQPNFHHNRVGCEPDVVQLPMLLVGVHTCLHLIFILCNLMSTWCVF